MDDIDDPAGSPSHSEAEEKGPEQSMQDISLNQQQEEITKQRQSLYVKLIEVKKTEYAANAVLDALSNLSGLDFDDMNALENHVNITGEKDFLGKLREWRNSDASWADDDSSNLSPEDEREREEIINKAQLSIGVVWEASKQKIKTLLLDMSELEQQQDKLLTLYDREELFQWCLQERQQIVSDINSDQYRALSVVDKQSGAIGLVQRRVQERLDQIDEWQQKNPNGYKIIRRVLEDLQYRIECEAWLLNARSLQKDRQSRIAEFQDTDTVENVLSDVALNLSGDANEWLTNQLDSIDEREGALSRSFTEIEKVLAESAALSPSTLDAKIEGANEAMGRVDMLVNELEKNRLSQPWQPYVDELLNNVTLFCQSNSLFKRAYEQHVSFSKLFADARIKEVEFVKLYNLAKKELSEFSLDDLTVLMDKRFSVSQLTPHMKNAASIALALEWPDVWSKGAIEKVFKEWDQDVASRTDAPPLNSRLAALRTPAARESLMRELENIAGQGDLRYGALPNVLRELIDLLKAAREDQHFSFSEHLNRIESQNDRGPTNILRMYEMLVGVEGVNTMESDDENFAAAKAQYLRQERINVPEASVSLLKKALIIDVAKRMSIAEALQESIESLVSLVPHGNQPLAILRGLLDMGKSWDVVSQKLSESEMDLLSTQLEGQLDQKEQYLNEPSAVAALADFDERLLSVDDHEHADTVKDYLDQKANLERDYPQVSFEKDYESIRADLVKSLEDTITSHQSLMIHREHVLATTEGGVDADLELERDWAGFEKTAQEKAMDVLKVDVSPRILEQKRQTLRGGFEREICRDIVNKSIVILWSPEKENELTQARFNDDGLEKKVDAECKAKADDINREIDALVHQQFNKESSGLDALIYQQMWDALENSQGFLDILRRGGQELPCLQSNVEKLQKHVSERFINAIADDLTDILSVQIPECRHELARLDSSFAIGKEDISNSNNRLDNANLRVMEFQDSATKYLQTTDEINLGDWLSLFESYRPIWQQCKNEITALVQQEQQFLRTKRDYVDIIIKAHESQFSRLAPLSSRRILALNKFLEQRLSRLPSDLCKNLLVDINRQQRETLHGFLDRLAAVPQTSLAVEPKSSLDAVLKAQLERCTKMDGTFDDLKHPDAVHKWVEDRAALLLEIKKNQVLKKLETLEKQNIQASSSQLEPASMEASLRSGAPLSASDSTPRVPQKRGRSDKPELTAAQKKVLDDKYGKDGWNPPDYEFVRTLSGNAMGIEKVGGELQSACFEIRPKRMIGGKVVKADIAYVKAKHVSEKIKRAIVEDESVAEGFVPADSRKMAKTLSPNRGRR
ncbi:MAG: hypothetical protein V4568_17075 [Pseudomonadota bacterium]